VGLLVFGSGLDWGTAYLGPDAVSPSATELLPEVRLVPNSADTEEPTPQQALDAEPDLIDDLGFDAEPDLDAGPAFDDDDLDDDFEDDFGDDFDDADLDAGPDLDAPPLTEPLVPAVPVTTLATRRQPVLTPAPVPSEKREVSPMRKPEREWGVKDHHPGYVGPETPTDVKIVVGALCVVVIAASIMIGMLVHYALAAVIVGVVGFLVICAFLWFSRL
jgi:hypothetical protein